MNTIDHDPTDAELTEALLVHHIGRAFDGPGLETFESPDSKPNEMFVIIDAVNHIYARITVDIIRDKPTYDVEHELDGRSDLTLRTDVNGKHELVLREDGLVLVELVLSADDAAYVNNKLTPSTD